MVTSLDNIERIVRQSTKQEEQRPQSETATPFIEPLSRGLRRRRRVFEVREVATGTSLPELVTFPGCSDSLGLRLRAPQHQVHQLTGRELSSFKQCTFVCIFAETLD